MQTRVRLTFTGEDGQRREVAVDSRRFTIGCSADNHLVIDAPGISRRHAVIESFDDGVYIYDCQTQQEPPPHGTLLNNAPLNQVAALHSGDLLTFGGTHDFTVRLDAPVNSTASPNTARPPDTTRQASNSTPPPRAASPLVLLPPAATAAHAGTAKPQIRSSVALMAGVAAGVLILLVGGLLFLLAGRQSTPGANGELYERMPESVETSGSQPSVPLAGNDNPARSKSITNAVADEELEREAARVVQLISGDDKAYVFPPQAVEDVRGQVEAYRQSAALRDALAAMQTSVRAIATQARGEGVQPELVIYAALAESGDGGQNSVAAARGLIPQLRELRATFGSSDADSSLLILAARTYGVGSKKSHPLLATIRRLVNNSFTERNVWHLREQGGLSDAAYRAVVRTIAAGVIAQDPRRYGVQSAPLVY